MNASGRTGTLPITANASHVMNVPLFNHISSFGIGELCLQLPQVEEQPTETPGPAFQNDSVDQRQLAMMTRIQHLTDVAFKSFDTWVHIGPQPPNRGNEADVEYTADQIEKMVLGIGGAAGRRTDYAPSYSVTKQAVDLLCGIMQMVLHRNINQHYLASVAWQYQGQGEGNLYRRLMHHDPGFPGGGVFETLNDIGHDVLYEEDVKGRLLLLMHQVQQANAGCSSGHRDQITRLSGRLQEGQGAAGGRRRRRVESRGESSRGRARHG